MKTTTVFTLFAIILSLQARAQYEYEWTAQIGGSNVDYAYAIALDTEGSVVSGGEFLFTVDFDPSEGGEAPITGVGLQNGFISKLNTDGEYLWAKSIGGGRNRVLDVHTDDENNVYACGWFKETVDFLPGDEEWLLTSNGQFNAFLAKYSPAGDLLWAFSLGGTYRDYMQAITVDTDGNIIVSGFFTNTVDFDPGAGVAELITNDGITSWDAFVAKYDSDGNYIWARQFAGDGLQEVVSVSVNSDGDLIAGEYFSGTIDCDPGAGELIFENGSLTDWQGFIMKLNSEGALVWGKSIGGPANDQVWGIGLDESDNVYATGGFALTVDFDPGAGVFEMTTPLGWADVFILKLNTNGDFIWSKAFEGGQSASAYAISVSEELIYITGYATGACDFDPGEGVVELDDHLGTDIFIAVLDTDGQYQWADRIGAFENDFGNAIVTDGQNIFVSGNFRHNYATFGEQYFFSQGHDDVFVTKIKPSITASSDVKPKDGILAYPNPAKDFVYIKDSEGSLEVILLDLSGKVLIREILSSGEALDVSKIAAGLYTLVVRSSEAFETVKISVVD